MVQTKDRKRLAREYVERRLGVREYDDLADILKGAELDLEWAPRRSTFYEWVAAWKKARARDVSGDWSLAVDETGRPDLVMDVMAALIGASHGVGVILTKAEARWIVRLAIAVPAILQDGTWQHAGGRTTPRWGTLNLYEWALRYVDAESAANADRLAELDSVMAMTYGAGGRHFPEAMAEG